MKLVDLTTSRTIPAPAEEIFEVWMDPNSPGGPWFGSDRVIIDPVVDGLFYHVLQHEGKTWAHYGRFITLDRGRSIVHTWVSEATGGLESVVAVTLEPRNGQTEVTLRHTGLPDNELGRQHEEGWTWALSALADAFSSRPATTQPA